VDGKTKLKKQEAAARTKERNSICKLQKGSQQTTTNKSNGSRKENKKYPKKKKSKHKKN
jgi:hypothetical protein